MDDLLDKKKKVSKFSVFRVLLVVLVAIIVIIFLLIFVSNRSCYNVCRGGECSLYCENTPTDILLKIIRF